MNNLICNGLDNIITRALEEMKQEYGVDFSLDEINLAELGRRTGISRGKLRRWKRNGFKVLPSKANGHKHDSTVLSGYTPVLDDLLRKGVTNSTVCFDRIRHLGYSGSLSSVKKYLASHKYLVPPKRRAVDPQGSRGQRYSTQPGEAYQMDWGFTNVITPYSNVPIRAACFAMICHHCGQRYIEFFPNAKQESLFIGMIHAFQYMGIPEYVLTDNMKSVVLKRDYNGIPIWQKDYENFMKAVGFKTKLCKPRHPFTKGKVERLVRFVKENFLADRIFHNLTDLNRDALAWCNEQNGVYRRASAGIPEKIHFSECAKHAKTLQITQEIKEYLSPERSISFDGFVTYENRRFGVPLAYAEPTARVQRDGNMLYIYSRDLTRLLVSYPVTWAKEDRYCKDQYAVPDQPEEFPTAPVHTEITMYEDAKDNILPFEKFNFDKEGTHHE